MSDEKHGPLHKLGHKAHSGVNLLVMYELYNKLHEYVPDWIETLKTFLEGLRHAHI